MRVVNLPNFLSTLRIAVLPLLAYLIQNENGLLSFIVLGLAVLTDFFDGWVARQYKLETVLGKLLDPVADKIVLCVVVVFLVARQHDSLNPWLATLLLSREFLVTGLRAMAAGEGLVIAARQSGKIKTVTQFIGLMLMVYSPAPSGFEFISLLGALSLWASVVLSYVSMVQYARTAYTGLKTRMMG